jgi:hypothetical protein
MALGVSNPINSNRPRPTFSARGAANSARSVASRMTDSSMFPQDGEARHFSIVAPVKAQVNATGSSASSESAPPPSIYTPHLIASRMADSTMFPQDGEAQHFSIVLSTAPAETPRTGKSAKDNSNNFSRLWCGWCTHDRAK